MGSVSDPFWLAVFNPEGSPLSLASNANVRREGESIEDAVPRVIGNPSMLEQLQYYHNNVAEINSVDRVLLYKIGDGQRKSPHIISVEEIARKYDVDLTSAFGEGDE